MWEFFKSYLWYGILSVSFLYSIKIKSIGFSCTLNISLTCVWLFNIICWSFFHLLIFSKYWFTELCKSVDNNNMKYSKNCLYYYYNFIRKFFKYWKASKFTLVGTGFPICWFLLQNLNCIIIHKYLQVLSLKWQAHLTQFWEMSSKYLSENENPWKMWPVELTTQLFPGTLAFQPTEELCHAVLRRLSSHDVLPSFHSSLPCAYLSPHYNKAIHKHVTLSWWFFKTIFKL